MRVQYQGTIEVQPPYQHVGYTAAALMTSRATAVDYTATLGAGLLALAMAVAMVAVRTRNAPRVPIAAAVGVLALLGGGVFALCSPGSVVKTRYDHVISPEFAGTLLTMERLIVTTDRMAAELGRVPTEQEWYARNGTPSDGWGDALTYRTPPGMRVLHDDGRDYEIVSLARQEPEPSIPGGIDYTTAIVSTALGRDGLAATEDDYASLSWAMKEYGGTRETLPKTAAGVLLRGGR